MRSLIALILLLTACFDLPESHHDKARKLGEQSEFDLAIREYWKHIDARLAVKDRPDWENPYIYLLDIGNLHLKQNDPLEAEKFYKMAEEKKVNPAYVNDRYRFLAGWHEERKEYEKALEILNKYHDRDPDLFNMVRDRIAKEIVSRDRTPEK